VSDNLEGAGEIRERIHRQSHNLTAFEQQNRSDENWNRFYAATDTLLDVETALGAFDWSKRAPSLLERYGFLQALVIAQDATRELSKSVGIEWSPYNDDRLKYIRELRQRVAGHPAWSEKAKKYNYQRSSAMIDLSENHRDGFNVVLYYEKGAEEVFVSFAHLQSENYSALIDRLTIVEKRMFEIEELYTSGSPP
jgi:hypothetical protein